MENINENLRQQYDYERKMLSVHSDWPQKVKNVNILTCEDVLRGYYLLADFFLQSDQEEKMYVGLKNVSLLESAVGRQIVSFGNRYKWDSIESIAATLFFGLIKNHAFHDGNKRIALLMLIYFLFKNNRVVNTNVKVFEELAVRTAANELQQYEGYKKIEKRYPDDSEVFFLRKFIMKKTRAIDKNFYALTYREFDQKLKRFNCRLDNPSGGFIDVVYYENEKHMFRTRTVEKRFNIGFKSWKAQVGAKAVKEALKKCRLTSEDLVDSMVFFKDTEPMNKLIEDFEGPLRRLKDK